MGREICYIINDERMIEPLPTDEILEKYPDYKDLFHKPDFLLLRVKK